MEILRCENVRKVYGSGNNQVVALDHIDLSVQKGEFVAIVGASGSGKSTLLHILGSVDKPTEGKVLIEGTELSAMNRTQAVSYTHLHSWSGGGQHHRRRCCSST